MQSLRGEVVSTGVATLALWKNCIHNERFRAGAENLAQYLALRHHDLSGLQPCLSAYGLTSLGRSEARVLTALDALLASLGRLSGLATPDYPPLLLVSDGERALHEEQNHILGRDPEGAKSLIMVTLPTEAATDAELVRRLLTAGANCVRINCAHDDEKIWADMIGVVRSTARQLGRDCRVLMDIAGPKCRIETVHGPEKIRLRRGETFSLVKEAHQIAGAAEIVATISFPEILDGLTVGAEVSIDDGKIAARVVSVEPGAANLKVFRVPAKGARLKVEKGVNFPNAELQLPPLGKDDLAALDFVAEHADLIGFSFVQRPADVGLLDRELVSRRAGRPPQPIVLKIETRLGVQNLPQLIVEAAGPPPARRDDRARRPGGGARLRPPFRDAGGNPLALRRRACAGDLGDAGSRQLRVGRRADPRRGDRRGDVAARRMRDAQQGALSRRSRHLPEGCAQTHGSPSIQEIGALRAAEFLA